MHTSDTTTLDYDLRHTRLGALLVAATSRGVCFARIDDDPAELEARLRAAFPRERPRRAPRALAPHCNAIAAYLDGASAHLEVPVDLRGTRFQRRVWRQLASIPRGETRSYAEVAGAVGRPGAARAVARACAANPVPVVVPCHRVVHADGRPGGYALGRARKQWLLASERSAIRPRGRCADQGGEVGLESTSTSSPTAIAPSVTTRR